MSRLRRNAVKEAFDNLPSGICFFDKNGIVTLCNYQMHRFVFALTGRDLQSLPELQEALRNSDTAKDNEYILEDGSVWRFSQEYVVIRNGTIYTQVTASDVTRLYKNKKELEDDNIRLREYGRRMRILSANINELIREEEILNMKMRVHDDIGRSIIATRQFLQQNKPMEELNLTAWKNAVRLLKNDNESSEEQDAISSLTNAANDIGIRILLDGELPENSDAVEIIIDAIRECMTNAVRHAGAKELYVHLTDDKNSVSAVITNDGTVPERKVVFGGGLASLNFRVRNCGGTMEVKDQPRFELTVSVPAGSEEIT
ncbi:sensor histidine kinase [Porcipelethomonas sp.]|uniref:sensor histidine kinase n=1 Tax=Porcipelethomonas sp. TaxID=2981675 RepID=UPI003EF391BD